MRDCIRLNRHEGNKSEVILKLIQDKARDALSKRIPHIKNDKKFKMLEARFLIANRVRRDTERKIIKFVKKSGMDVHFCTSGRDEREKTSVSIKVSSYDCSDIPSIVIQDLQKATNLQELGKRKEANEIWERYIRKYQLD